MEENKFRRYCLMHGRSECFNNLCEHQCYMDESGCREPEKPQSEKTWDELMKKFRETHHYYASSNATNQPIHIHIHNDFGPLLESFLSIHQKLDKIMATIEEVQQAVADLQAQVDTTQAAIAAAIKALEDQIAAGSAATPEQLQGIIDSLKAVQSDVASTPTA